MRRSHGAVSRRRRRSGRCEGISGNRWCESTEVTMIGMAPSVGFFSLVTSALAAAQTYAPVVTMSVTLPDGRTRELTAPESGLATVSLKDGTEYGFQPTIQD